MPLKGGFMSIDNSPKTNGDMLEKEKDELLQFMNEIIDPEIRKNIELVLSIIDQPPKTNYEVIKLREGTFDAELQ